MVEYRWTFDISMQTENMSSVSQTLNTCVKDRNLFCGLW